MKATTTTKASVLISCLVVITMGGIAKSDPLKTPASTPSLARDTEQHSYVCPMHAEVTGKEGDKCPKCGMNLEQQTYACPMHPEVTGKEGDKCPKCGMKLEHNDNATTSMSQVAMRFNTKPATLKPNEAILLSMTPTLEESPNERVDLDIEHTKKIHLIVVSDDLSWFDHIHPEEQSDGSYTVPETFPAPGSYTLFADYKPSGANHVVDKLKVTVDGAVAAAAVYGADRLTGYAGDGFSVMLSPEGGKFLTNQPTHLAGVILKNGKEVDVNTLEDYLGAKAHMVVVSLDDKEYLHVHPGVEGAAFDLHTTFEKPGVYRGWLQFQSAGKIYTSDFVFRVSEGKSQGTKGTSEHH